VILKKPCETPSRLNLAHPHAQGLEASYLFNGQGHKVFDYTCNQNELSVVGASYAADGLQCDASGEYASLDNTNQVVNSDRGTVILRFKSLGVITDGIIRVIFGRWDASWSTGDFVIFKYSNDNVYFGLKSGDDLRYAYYAASNFTTWTTGIQIAVKWDKDNTVSGSNYLAMNVNGVNIPSAGGVLTPGWNSFTVGSMAIGNDFDDTTRHSNCIFEYIYPYSTVLSDDVLKSIYEDPYAVYDVYSNIMFSFFFSTSAPLVITTQPESVTVAKETDASFSVEATGGGTLTYQWYRNSESQAGETSSTYSLTTTLLNNNDSIYCIVSDDNSSLQSDTVFLTVVSCVMNTNADVLEEKDYPIPQKIEYKEAHEK